MAWYRAYFLNEKHRISDAEDFRNTSDEQALLQARSMLRERDAFVAVELWQEARPVFLCP